MGFGKILGFVKDSHHQRSKFFQEATQTSWSAGEGEYLEQEVHRTGFLLQVSFPSLPALKPPQFTA